MNYSNLKLSAANAYGWIRSHGIFVIVGVGLLLFGFISLQNYLDRRSEERENARTAKNDAEFAEKMKVFQSLIEMANRDHQTTTAILDTMQKMTKNIDTLAATDREITARVNKISEEEYTNARSQKNNQKAVANHTARPNRPLRTRELEVLRSDAELYPDDQ